MYLFLHQIRVTVLANGERHKATSSCSNGLDWGGQRGDLGLGWCVDIIIVAWKHVVEWVGRGNQMKGSRDTTVGDDIR